MEEKKRKNGKEVVIKISGEESPKASIDTDNSKRSFPEPSPEAVGAGLVVKSEPTSCPSPEIARSSPSRSKPLKIPNTNDNILTQRRSLARSVYSKRKSRFGEQPYNDSPNNKSINSSIRTNSFAPTSPGGPGEDEEEEIIRKDELIKEKSKRMKTIALIEWAALVFIVGCLVASLTVNKWEKSVIWGLEIWKWCVLVFVTLFGRLVTNWIILVIVLLIEMNILLRKKVLYFVYGLEKSVQVFIWLAMVLITWVLLFNRGVKHSKDVTKILDYITWTLFTILIGAFLWLLKTLLLKILASNFHVNRFFDRIQESVFHQYVLQTLSRRPWMKDTERVSKSPSFGKLTIRSKKKGKESIEAKIIDMEKVHKMKPEKVSTWAMKVLVDAFMNSELSTISNTLDESVNDGGKEADKEITNENDARVAANEIFSNVAQPGGKYMEEEDLLRFMIKEEVDLFCPLIEGWEKGQIDEKALTDWVVKVYRDRKALAYALNDTKTVVKQLNKLVTGILIVVTFILWLLLVEVATTKFIVFLSSQIAVAASVFGNTCKTIFEAIIFVFVTHPFDVGDRCVVDGVPLLVEEMNLLTTVFLKLDNKKVYYPNSVLATKPIENYTRSPYMRDTIEFSIDFMTPTGRIESVKEKMERIELVKEKINKYLKNTPQHWHPNHEVEETEIENDGKIKMALYCNHTMNFQERGEKNRRSELVKKLWIIFEEQGVRFNLLPQQGHPQNP